MGKNGILKFMSLFDQYSTPFQINFQFKTTFQSVFGGIISLIIYIILIFVIVFLFIYFVTKSEQKLSTFSEVYDEYPFLNLTTDHNNISYSKKEDDNGYFIIGLLIIKDQQYINKSDFESLFKIFIQSRRRDKNGTTTDGEEYSFDECNKVIPNVSKFLNSDLLEKAYCPVTSYFSLQGTHDSDIFLYQSLRVHLNDPYNETLRKEASNYKITILYTGYSIDNDIKKSNKSPIKYSVKTYDIDIIANLRTSLNMFLKKNIFESKQNIWAIWAKPTIQKCIGLSYFEKQLEKKQNDSIVISIRVDDEYIKYHRTFFNFFTYLAYIGGILKVFIFLGALIAIPMNSKLMNVAVSNRMFNMINPENNKEIQKSYKDYKELEIKHNGTPDVFKSMNPILYKISTDYYKYERNKGMNFTIKEALSKMFCCCCKIESIDKKDKIFKLSSKELQDRLSTISIGQFAQQDNFLTNLKLKQEKLFFSYIKSNTILFKNLNGIWEKYNKQQIQNSASPLLLAYQKQCNLVDGFNTMRNKGDLTKEDLLTIDLFHIDYELIKQFFIMYSDRLEFLYPKKEKKPFLSLDK